jgi:hypothetical protein
MKPWIYDERTGMVAVYSGPEMNCLEVPSDSFIYVRHWKNKADGTLGYEQVEEDKMIGRLVAAAPELLAAAEGALIWLSGDKCCRACQAVGAEPCKPGCVADKLRMAIAKAEGK